ncbi:hypothetical protein ACLOJK_032647 [Asimina triloba]
MNSRDKLAGSSCTGPRSRYSTVKIAATRSGHGTWTAIWRRREEMGPTGQAWMSTVRHGSRCRCGEREAGSTRGRLFNRRMTDFAPFQTVSKLLACRFRASGITDFACLHARNISTRGCRRENFRRTAPSSFFDGTMWTQSINHRMNAVAQIALSNGYFGGHEAGISTVVAGSVLPE